MDIKKRILAFNLSDKRRPRTIEEAYRVVFEESLKLPSWDKKSAPIYNEIWRAKFLEERMQPIVDVPF